MDKIKDDLSEPLAARIRSERDARGWSLAELAGRSGVSKAMLSRVERGEASPTAALLGRISGALGLTLSRLLARAEGGASRLTRAAEQPVWHDPETRYRRRQVSAEPDLPLELTEVALPAGATVAFPAASYAFLRQVIWVLEGTLDFVEDGTRHRLEAGDSLRLGPPSDCAFANPGPAACRYLVAVLRR